MTYLKVSASCLEVEFEGGTRAHPLLNCKCKEITFSVEAFKNTGVKTGHTTNDIKATASGRRHCDVWSLVYLIIGAN